MNRYQRFIVLIALLAGALAGCASQQSDVEETTDPGVTAPNPDVNDLRINGIVDLDVYETVPMYAHRYYEVVCTIAPLGKFHVGRRDVTLPGYRYVKSWDGICEGWAWLP